MIPCTLIYKVPNGAASDSLQKKVKLHYIPNIGETIHIDSIEGTINQVESFVDTVKLLHTVHIYYS